jgi:hypothetical protein
MSFPKLSASDNKTESSDDVADVVVIKDFANEVVHDLSFCAGSLASVRRVTKLNKGSGFGYDIASLIPVALVLSLLSEHFAGFSYRLKYALSALLLHLNKH